MNSDFSRVRSAEQHYYENEVLWAQDFEQDPQERARLDASVSLIPSNVRTVLDVGCGNGAFLNRLVGRFDRLCGVDRSEAALRFVRTEKHIASADHLPFADGEFDLVTSMEVIEHLPQGTFERALRELSRISKKWIIVSVPYREDRHLSLVRCPKCLCEFNRSYHLRSFDNLDIQALFTTVAPEIDIVSLDEIGSANQYIGLRTAKRLAERFRSLDLPIGSVCPHCGYSRPAHVTPDGPGSVSSNGALGSAKNYWPRRSQARWHLGLYKKL